MDNKISTEEILKSCIWKDGSPWLGSYKFYSPVFIQDIEIQFIAKNDKAISDRTTAIVNDFLNLGSNDLELIKEYLWEDCKECCENIGYGFEVPEGKCEVEINHEEFGVFNKEDAYNKSHLYYVLIIEDDQEFQSNFGEIHFDNDWSGHKCVIVMKNGKIVGYGEDGVYVGKYEDEAN